MKPSESFIQEFKIGDKVRIRNKELIKDIKCKEFDYISLVVVYGDQLYYMVESGDGHWFAGSSLELVETSEQIAVNKKLEELKDKINKKIKKNIDNNIINFETLTKEEILEMLK